MRYLTLHKLDFASPGFTRLNHRFLPYLIMVFAAGVQVFILSYITHFFVPKSVNYNFASSTTCIGNPVLMPNLLKHSAQGFNIDHRAAVSIGEYPVYSTSTCFSLASPPSQTSKSIKLSTFGIQPISQKITINGLTMPTLSFAKQVTEPTSIESDLAFTLSTADKTFNYRLRANDKTADCTTKETVVYCPLKTLDLKQSTQYSITLSRYLGDQLDGDVISSQITTVSAVHIVSSSIPNGQLVKNKPTTIEVTTDKEIADAKEVKLTTNNNPVAFSTEIKGNQIIIKPATELPRENNFNLVIGKIYAKDNGYLEQPFVLNFATSGGPKPLSAGVSTTGVSVGATPTITFDSTLNPSFDPSTLVKLSANGAEIPVSLTKKSTTITIKPATLTACTSYTIAVDPGIQNEYGIANTSAWSYSFRTLCQQSFSIGTSAGGRPITAYKFGNGPTKLLYIGATHGDEKSSKYLLDSWINELEANYTKIPSSKTIIVIPLINPDGFAAGTRVNGRNVDLNRNFPISNWKSDVIMPDKNLLIGGGGSSPLSEPESKALADYTSSLTPRLILTYHSKGSMVVANEAGDSVAIAQAYGKNSGFWATSESKLGTTFAYDTTGAYENWLAEKLSIPALLIELKTHTNNEFQTHKSALWTTVNL